MVSILKTFQCLVCAHKFCYFRLLRFPLATAFTSCGPSHTSSNQRDVTVDWTQGLGHSSSNSHRETRKGGRVEPTEFNTRGLWTGIPIKWVTGGPIKGQGLGFWVKLVCQLKLTVPGLESQLDQELKTKRTELRTKRKELITMLRNGEQGNSKGLWVPGHAFLIFKIQIYLLDCIRSQLWHRGSSVSMQYVGSLVAACEILVALCGIQFPNQGLNPCPLIWEHGVLATEP